MSYDSYVLSETGERILLEGGSGALLLEIAVPVSDGFFDGELLGAATWDSPSRVSVGYDRAGLGAATFDEKGA